MARKPFVLVLERELSGNNLNSLFAKFGMRLVEEKKDPTHHYLVIMEEANLPATKNDRSIKHLVLAINADTIWATKEKAAPKVRISGGITTWMVSASTKLEKRNDHIARPIFEQLEDIVAKLHVTFDRAAYSKLILEYLNLKAEFEKLIP